MSNAARVSTLAVAPIGLIKKDANVQQQVTTARVINLNDEECTLRGVSS